MGLAALTLGCDPLPPTTGDTGADSTPATTGDTDPSRSLESGSSHGGSSATSDAATTGGESSSDGTIPVTCGNGVLDPGEECDGTDFGAETCITQSPGILPWTGGGTLACDASCTFDVSECWACGNGVLEPNEECDGTDFGGQSCADLDPIRIEGTPICTPNCWLAPGVGCCIPTGNQCYPGANACCSGGGVVNSCAYDLWPMICL